MAGKHIPNLTLLTSFITRSHIRLLYFRFVSMYFFYFQLSFGIFGEFYAALACFEIEQLAPSNYLLGKKTVPPKQRKVGALFGTVLKQNQSALNKAPTLRCFPWTVFVPIN